MEKRIYNPQPIDTTDVSLPKELESLVEAIAKNVHDEWAQARLKEGWTFGQERSDARKEHPCLVEYDELPESEKEYDRNTAMGTLRLISKLGFKIVKV